MDSSAQVLSLQIVELHKQYASGKLSPIDVIHNVYKKISSYPDKAVWTHLIPQSDAITRAEELDPTTVWNSLLSQGLG